MQWCDRSARKKGALKLKRYSSRLVPALFFSVVAAGHACAENAAEVASRWGLIGRWSFDCNLPPDHDRGAVLSYEIAANGRLIHGRDFGDKHDENEVIGASISDGNLLNLRILFRPIKQTREFGLQMLP